MPISWSILEPLGRPIISVALSEGDIANERLVVAFDDGEELYFKVEKLIHKNNTLVLDTEMTDPDLVDEVLLPRIGAKGKDKEVDADIFSIITPEQYKQLTIAHLLPGQSFVPQNGKGMLVCVMSKLSLGFGCMRAVRSKYTIDMITSLQLDS